MPPRIVTLAIVVFWLGTTAWLFYRDLWPQLAPGEPPPFAIDKSDETRLTTPGPASGPRTTWKVYRNGVHSYTLNTWVQYDETDDSFTLWAELKASPNESPRPGLGALLPQFTDIKMDSWYHVSREGGLREIGFDTRYKVTQQGDSEEVNVRLEGQPDGQRFAPRLRVALPNLDARLSRTRPEQTMEAVAVSHRGIVMNPLHPVRRLPGLRTGQSWQVPMLDPLATLGLFAALMEGDAKLQLAKDAISSVRGVQVLRAEVQHDTVSLDWRQREWLCFQINYTGDQATMELTTWVRAEDGAVLRQEVGFLWGDRWLIERENDT